MNLRRLRMLAPCLYSTQEALRTNKQETIEPRPGF